MADAPEDSTEPGENQAPDADAAADGAEAPTDAPAEGEAAAPVAEAPPEEAEAQEPQPSISKKEQSKQDALNTEFVYYSAVLKILSPTIGNEKLRNTTRLWIKKLFRPEYHSSKLREKRNQYLATLCVSILADCGVHIFRMHPPEGPLPDIHDLEVIPVQSAEWELDTMWQDTLLGLPEDFHILSCPVHQSKEACLCDHRLDNILDQEFQFMLYMARPYAHLLTNGPDKTRVATWLQILCSVHGPECCSAMKAIRNDYIMALLGYLQDLRAVGPFSDYPSWETLPPLIEAAKKTYEDRPLTDPTGPEANEFLMDQPMPEDGAFCYLAVTGDLIEGSFGS